MLMLTSPGRKHDVSATNIRETRIGRGRSHHSREGLPEVDRDACVVVEECALVQISQPYFILASIHNAFSTHSSASAPARRSERDPA
jgi:hypothetical protein